MGCRRDSMAMVQERRLYSNLEPFIYISGSGWLGSHTNLYEEGSLWVCICVNNAYKSCRAPDPMVPIKY